MRVFQLHGAIVKGTDAEIVEELRRIADQLAAQYKCGPVFSKDLLASWQVDEDTVECPICGAMTKADRIEDGHVCGHCDACGTERFLVYIPKVCQ